MLNNYSAGVCDTPDPNVGARVTNYYKSMFYFGDFLYI